MFQALLISPVKDTRRYGRLKTEVPESFMSEAQPYEFDLIDQAMTTPIEIDAASGDGDFDHLKVTCKISEDDVDTSAFGLLYTISLLSFIDARPAGVSEMHYNEKIDWSATDLLRCLSYVHGELRFDADYVRGRRMKTIIYIKSDGTLILETSGRGQAATRWISRIQGKKVLSLICGGE